MYLAKKTYSISGFARYLKWFLAIAFVLVTGFVYRITASRLKIIAETPITLPVPLSNFPEKIHGWIGEDISLSESVQKVAGNDDFVNRRYLNKSKKQWANVYIAYSARPRTMQGHRPQICYVGAGWVHDSSEQSKIISFSGLEVPCLLHRFHQPGSNRNERVVLNFYIVNGQLTNDENVFSGLGWRTPNIAGDPARYVAQIQISSVLENSVRTATKDMVDIIMRFFPDKNNKVPLPELQ